VNQYIDCSDPAQAFFGIVTPDGRTWCYWCERQLSGNASEHWCSERRVAAEAYARTAPRLIDVRRQVEQAGGWDAYMERPQVRTAPDDPCHCTSCMNRRAW
jgi:hypothetical protein